MKERLKHAARRTAENPVFRKSVESLKSKRSIWSVSGVILFFILPEIVAFIWGEKITAWAHEKTLTDPTEAGRKLYWLVEKLFEDGGSYVNLGIGILLLFWLVWDWRSAKD